MTDASNSEAANRSNPKPPKLQPWGLRVAYVVDPTGVLWHVAEDRPDTVHDRG